MVKDAVGVVSLIITDSSENDSRHTKDWYLSLQYGEF